MARALEARVIGTVPQPVEWTPGGMLRLVDQTLLPAELAYFECREVSDLAGAISTLKVRGAPSIGVAAAYGLCLAAERSRVSGAGQLLSELEDAASTLRQTRPTAANLSWALDRVLDAARSAAGSGVGAIREAVSAEARRIDRENQDANLHMGRYGAELLRDGMSVLTHCNTGPLAAGGIGSALGVIYTAHSEGKRLHVWVDETRPLLQGARLTAWELSQWGVPCTLIADSMAASLMRAGRVDAVLVGADRIAANGDLANKIGTYGLAVLARAHGIPFYSAAPLSTFDPRIASGDQITIEQRKAEEVTHHGGRCLAPDGVQVYNPAFDVTPASLISCIITESGLLKPPFEAGLVESLIKEQWSRATGNRSSQTPAAVGS